jgi:hypothetical protein
MLKNAGGYQTGGKMHQGGRGSVTVEFYSLVFPSVGEMYTDTSDPFARVKVRLYFRDVATDICMPIEIDTKISYCANSTISEIYASALTEVKQVIAAAHALLADCTLGQLQALSAEERQRSG